MSNALFYVMNSRDCVDAFECRAPTQNDSPRPQCGQPLSMLSGGTPGLFGGGVTPPPVGHKINLLLSALPF